MLSTPALHAALSIALGPSHLGSCLPVQNPPCSLPVCPIPVGHHCTSLRARELLHQACVTQTTDTFFEWLGSIFALWCCRYEDQGKVRPVVHRASLVEMAVPYGDPNAPFQRKCAFDVGDYGLGFCANSLALGCDCLGHIKYFDAVLNDSKGECSGLLCLVSL